MYVCDDCLTVYGSAIAASMCCDPVNDIDRPDHD